MLQAVVGISITPANTYESVTASNAESATIAIANNLWFQWLVKNQTSLDDEGMFLSFNLIQEERTSLFLFNELVEKKKQENQVNAKSATVLKATSVNTSGQFQEIAFPLSCKFPVVHNSYFESKSTSHYFLRSDLNYNSVLKIRY